MNGMLTGATFAFSDEELLDALTTVHDDAAVMDFAAFDRPSLWPEDVGDAVARAETVVVASSSFPQGAPSSARAAAPEPMRPHGLSVDGDDADATDSSSEQSSLHERESLHSSPTKSNAPKPKRKRRKHELDAVRALANSLETQLESLKRRHHPEHPGTNMFWKRVADQLLLDRQRATAENARLKDIFQDQAKVLKAIQKSIQKSPDLEKLGVAPSASPALDTMSSNDIYNRLFQDVAASYSGTDTVLEQAGVRKATDHKRRVNMSMTTEDGRNVMTMEVAESRTVPFHVSQVEDSAWGFLTRTTCGINHDGVFGRVFKAKGDDVFGVCKINCSLGLYTLNGDVAVRRFTEGDRMTYVWECLGRCDNEPNPFNSFRLQEKGWVVFEPSPSDPLRKSVFRTCVQFVPQPMDPSQELGAAAKDIGLTTEVALSVYEKTIDYIYINVMSELSGGGASARD